jgi:hypothetical protein
VSVELERLLLLLADRDRLMLLAGSGRFFGTGHECRSRHGRRSRPPLPSTECSGRVGRALGAAMGRQVTITERVDPHSLRTRREGRSVVFDGSIARQIERLREKLLADV